VRPLDHFNHFHHHSRVEVVQVCDLRGAPGHVGEAAGDDGRRVGREHRVGWAEPVEVGEHPPFCVEVLHDRLDGQVRLGGNRFQALGEA
jgi:hypothetical protein